MRASFAKTFMTGIPFILDVMAIVPWSDRPVMTAEPSLPATLVARYVSNALARPADAGGSRVPATSVKRFAKRLTRFSAPGFASGFALTICCMAVSV
ncbi:hypothetical protein D3C77_458010 [compost metagenome]